MVSRTELIRHSETYKKLYLLVLIIMLVLPACTIVALNSAANRIFQRHDINLKEKTYAATDFLIQNARHYVDKHDVIVMKPLVDLNAQAMSSDFAKLIPYQIGTRLLELGYKVDLSQVATHTLDKPIIINKEKPDYLCGGTYRKDGREIYLSLEITGAQTQKIYSHFDYSMPITVEIGKLSQPKTQIYITTE